jgi:hypothetical protein
MYPWVVPLQVEGKKQFDREFCVRFFGTYDYHFTTCEKVLQYESFVEAACVLSKTGHSKVNSAYQVALREAEDYMAILNDLEYKRNVKPKRYKKITQNRPVHPVKLKKPIAEEICVCSENDLSPCGKDSDCINMHLNIECGRNCPAKDKCQNQKLRNHENIEIKIAKTKDRGFGAYCTNDVEPNTFITEYIGELINQAEMKSRMEKKLKNKETEFYFLTVETDIYVDAEFYSNESRFLNHSCDPNCVTKKVTTDGNTRVGIYSNKFIPAVRQLNQYNMIYRYAEFNFFLNFVVGL